MINTGIYMNEIKELYNEHIKQVQKRFDRYLEKKTYNSVIIHSGSLQYTFLDDYSLPFKVNPHFAYWLPVTDNPNCFIYYEQNKKPKLFYFKIVDYWHSMPEDPNGFWADSFDIVMIESLEDIKKNIGSFDQSCYIGQFANELSWAFHSVNDDELIHEIHWDRAIKSAYERHCISEANAIAAKAHYAAKMKFYEGASELEIHYEYLATLGILEKNTPYNNIIALNENSATLHYTDCKTIQFSNENLHSFLIDAGASYNGYASDITRTYSFNKDEFDELINEFDKKQLEIVDQMKENKSYVDVHRFAHLKVAEILNDFKFVILDPKDIVHMGISKSFFPHGIGHMLGLQVHDVGGQYKDQTGKKLSPPDDFPSLRSTRIIQKNQVYTIEPGIYFIDSLLSELKSSKNAQYMNWDKINLFRKYGGIRIEDNVSITDSGIDNYTRNAFSSI
jgi:Xaa-Pro dipeptidase